ncbi:MAG: hypothetical protein ABR875_03095 [Minisyncoccia bacterium]|jgi:hypothetical protein
MAKNNPSSVVSGAGFLTAVWTEFMSVAQKLGVTDEQIHELSKPEGRDKIAKIAEAMAKAIASITAGIFSILLDYSLPLSDMITAGKYDWVNSDITAKHFPLDKSGGKVELDAQLIHYGKSMSSEQVISDLDSKGLRPALLPELLAFGAKYPDKQRDFPIIALGSKWRDPHGSLRVPDLDGGGSGRDLDLRWFDDEWGGYCRFLAVRKS